MLGTLSKIFGAIVARRNRRFDSGRGTVHVDAVVISVGNLTVGGTGKSPIVQYLVRLVLELGHRPGIVLRGYRRSTRGLLVVHDGTQQLANAREAGDEAAMHALKLSVPVVVAESKVDAAVHAAGFLDCDVIIVDDGFQHRALHRDVDIVIVDRATMDDPRLLPAGRLREPLTSLQRAHVVVLTADVREDEVRPYCSAQAIICRYQVVAHAPELSGVRVIAMSGIANPNRFHATARACGVDVVATKAFKDHHVYTKEDVENVIALAREHRVDVLTTEKDVVKLTTLKVLFEEAGVTLRVLPIEAHVVHGASELHEFIRSRMILCE